MGIYQPLLDRWKGCQFKAERLLSKSKFEDPSKYRMQVAIKLSEFGEELPDHGEDNIQVFALEKAITELYERECAVKYENKYRDQFRLLKDLEDKKDQYEKLTSLLYQAGIDGLYLPIAHFSSMALAKESISFQNISKSDETVALGKLIFKE